MADLGPTHNYLFPQCIAVTDTRPDLVAHNEQVIIIELTVCCEACFEGAQQRKVSKNLDLVYEAKNNGYSAHLITLEVESRGFVHTESFNHLRQHISISRNMWRLFLQELLVGPIRSGHVGTISQVKSLTKLLINVCIIVYRNLL